MLISNITGRGNYQKGAKIGQPFIRVKFNGEHLTIGVTENIAKEAANKGYVKLKVHGLTDAYPTTKDSTTLDGEGKPLYKAGDKLTVAEYWNKRKALNPDVTPRVLVNFDGFLTDMEEAELAKLQVSKMQMA